MSNTPKVVILAGGRGARLAEETDVKPKPMVEIGDRPILWHIIKHYATCGCTEFYVALGYKGHMIERCFLDEVRLAGELILRAGNGDVRGHGTRSDDWTIHLCDTGLDQAALRCRDVTGSTA